MPRIPNDLNDIRLTLSVEAEQIVSDLNWNGTSLSYGLPKRVMEHPHTHAFFFEKATDAYTAQQVAEAFERDALHGVREMVLSATAEDVHESIDSGETDVIAFNESVGEWPHRACAYLAAREVEHHHPDASEGYLEDCEDFARAEGLYPSGESAPEPPSSSDLNFSPNPFESDELSVGEARCVLYCRNYVFEDPSLDELDRIDSYDSFIERLRDGDNIRTAISKQAFPTELPDGVIGAAAFAEEWEDADPSDIETGSCDSCPTVAYEIVSESGELTWVDSNGNNCGEMRDVASLDTGPVIDIAGRSEQLCGECHDQIVDGQQYDVGVYDGDGNAARVAISGRFIIDISGSTASVLENEEARELLEQICTEGPRNPDNETLAVTPNPNYGPTDSQRDTIGNALRRGSADIDNPMVFFSQNQAIDGFYGVLIPNRPEPCEEAKTLLAEH